MQLLYIQYTTHLITIFLKEYDTHLFLTHVQHQQVNCGVSFIQQSLQTRLYSMVMFYLTY